MQIEAHLQNLLPFYTLYPSTNWIVAFGYASGLDLIRKQICKLNQQQKIVKEIVVPEWIQTRLTKQGIVYVKKPIFSNYLFIDVVSLDNPEWRTLEEVKGINEVLSETYKDVETKLEKKKPFTLSFGEIAHIIRLSAKTLISLQQTDKRSLIGKTVDIITGPFSDLTGVVIDEKSTTVKVELAVLHAILPIELPKRMIMESHTSWYNLLKERYRKDR